MSNLVQKFIGRAKPFYKLIVLLFKSVNLKTRSSALQG
jgi:hypothetical protein